jgi:hypothetical protein
MSLLPECKSIQDQIPPVDREIEQTLQQLENADPGQRPALFQQFRTPDCEARGSRELARM